DLDSLRRFVRRIAEPIFVRVVFNPRVAELLAHQTIGPACWNVVEITYEDHRAFHIFQRTQKLFSLKYPSIFVLIIQMSRDEVQRASRHLHFSPNETAALGFARILVQAMIRGHDWQPREN